MSPPCHFFNKVLHKFQPYYKIGMLWNSNITKAEVFIKSWIIQKAYKMLPWKVYKIDPFFYVFIWNLIQHQNSTLSLTINFNSRH